MTALPSAFFSEPPISDFPHRTSSLCPPSAGAQGEWLWTKFCVLTLYEGTYISSRLSTHSERKKRNKNSAAFHSLILPIYVPFLSLVLWSGKSGLVMKPHASQGKPPTPETSLKNLSYALWEQCSSFSCFCPSYQTQCDFFYKSLIIRPFLS